MKYVENCIEMDVQQMVSSMACKSAADIQDIKFKCWIGHKRIKKI